MGWEDSLSCSNVGRGHTPTRGFPGSGDIGVHFLLLLGGLLTYSHFDFNRIRYPGPTRGGRTPRGQLLINTDLLSHGVWVGHFLGGLVMLLAMLSSFETRIFLGRSSYTSP